MTTKAKIAELKEWYAKQLSGDIRLFKGEENEMTTENIFHKLNHYQQLEGKESLRDHHVYQINRAHYFNCQKWPLQRIKERELKLFPVKQQEEAA